MIAQYDGGESPFEPVDSVCRVRPAVDQITDAEEPIASGLVSHRVKGARKRANTPVHIANDEIAAVGVDAERDGGMRYLFGSMHLSSSGPSKAPISTLRDC